MFAERFIEPELMDHADPEEARGNLADLVRINRHFGGHLVIRRTLAQVARRDEKFTLLDIGAASGDTARVLTPLYPKSLITSLDYSAVNLSAAPPPKVIADAFELPLKPGSFDFVLCSLFLHHFGDDQVVELLRAFYDVARRALLVIDLERHILPYWFLRATQPVYGWRGSTVYDGQISVRASFRRRELARLANRAGVKNPAVTAYHPAFRLSLVAAKP